MWHIFPRPMAHTLGPGMWARACPACGLDVAYHSPRRECVKCGKWVHALGPDVECLRRGRECHMCLYGRPNLGPLRRFLTENVGIEEKSLDSGLILMTSIIWCGPDEARVCEITGLDPEVVRVRAERLRKSQVWGDCKTVNIDDDVKLDDAGSVSTWIILAVLCAEGEVVRIPP